jgi:transposase
MGRSGKIETVVLDKVKLGEQFLDLHIIPGVGMILALTKILATDTIERFPKMGNFSSYCRKVPTIWKSNKEKR